jgi:transcriptional regulator with XRE-family HTH domain
LKDTLETDGGGAAEVHDDSAESDVASLGAAEQLPPLARKIERLFQTVRPAGGHERYTVEQVAAGIRKAGGPTISSTYIFQLRRGIRDNPTIRHIEALAAFFGVPPSYFFDPDAEQRTAAELDLMMAMRDQGVQTVAFRTLGISQANTEQILGMIDMVRRLEGLPVKTSIGPVEQPE